MKPSFHISGWTFSPEHYRHLFLVNKCKARYSVALPAVITAACSFFRQTETTRLLPRDDRTSRGPRPTTAVAGQRLVFLVYGGTFAIRATLHMDATIFPTTVGTVLVVINDDTNQTSLTTKTNTEYKSNGTLNILTRTDTNGAGTVTKVINPDGYGVTM